MELSLPGTETLLLTPGASPLLQMKDVFTNTLAICLAWGTSSSKEACCAGSHAVTIFYFFYQRVSCILYFQLGR